MATQSKPTKAQRLPSDFKTVWPSGLRRQTQVLVERSAWVRTPQLSFFMLPTPFVFEVFCGLVWTKILLQFGKMQTLPSCSSEHILQQPSQQRDHSNTNACYPIGEKKSLVGALGLLQIWLNVGSRKQKHTSWRLHAWRQAFDANVAAPAREDPNFVVGFRCNNIKVFETRISLSLERGCRKQS